MAETSTQRPLEVACPQCRNTVAWTAENPYRPFCSKRCRLLDLGAWAEESHRIAGEPAMDEADIDAMLARSDRDASE
ncbi:DNA gyrase inhibitor YacG [Halomonas sp. 18H]|uniref:DNA gyrase inhibitor YacG n=1 Tax=Halomonas almeriensis TaxID=308163 RepID=UPI0022324451|nr:MULTISPECIES: DNA gyrase inhibitor YacG [Halomonas]MCW4151941.1 DNA gyrase inhibitor YacG [Halomonas sp. 18H]MDN3554176.1 DNA gyrase inhibitor YacG [Halomonas almeriensis]